VEEVRQFHDTANTVPLDPNHDLPLLMREQGLERTLQRVEVKPAKDLRLQMRRYETADRAGEGDLKGVQWQLRTPTLQLRLHERNIAPSFNRLRDLTRIEQMLFHNEQGIHRFDWDAAITTKQFGLAVSQMRIREIGAGLHRLSARLIHPVVELHYHQRQVDADFARAHDLADPERDFFAQLRGYRQRDWTAKLRPAQNLQLELFGFQANNPLEHIANRRQRYRVMWQPAKNLTVGRQQDKYESDKTLERLYQDEYDRSDLQYQSGLGTTERLSGAATHWRHAGKPAVSRFGILAVPVQRGAQPEPCAGGASHHCHRRAQRAVSALSDCLHAEPARETATGAHGSEPRRRARRERAANWAGVRTQARRETHLLRDAPR
jgi:hypothetical protein